MKDDARKGNGSLVKTPIRARIPIIRELFEAIEADGLQSSAIAAKTGIYKQHPQIWRNGSHAPRLDLFVAFAEAAGYRLKIEKIEKPAE